MATNTDGRRVYAIQYDRESAPPHSDVLSVVVALRDGDRLGLRRRSIFGTTTHAQLRAGFYGSPPSAVTTFVFGAVERWDLSPVGVRVRGRGALGVVRGRLGNELVHSGFPVSVSKASMSPICRPCC